MTDEQKLQRRIAFARWEGYSIGGRDGNFWYKVEAIQETHLCMSYRAAIDRLPDYDNSAEARERLMEKATKGYLMEFLAVGKTYLVIVKCNGFQDKDARGRADTLPEAFLAALYAALQAQGDKPNGE